MPQPRYVRVVSLWIHPGQEAVFEAFEPETAGIMARHGGRIDPAVRTGAVGPGAGRAGDSPFEGHIVSFPDQAAADSHAADPETVKVRLRRAEIISRTAALDGYPAGPC